MRSQFMFSSFLLTALRSCLMASLVLSLSVNGSEDDDDDRAIKSIQVWGEKVTLDGPDLRWGRKEIHPYAVTQWSYTDNVFQDKKNRQADHFLSFIPGVVVHAPIGEHLALQTRLESRFFRYFDHTELNILREHEATVRAHLKFGRYRVMLSNIYEYLDQVGDIQFTDRQTRWTNKSEMRSSITFEPVKLNFGYKRYFRRWQSRTDAYLDHVKDVVNVGLDFNGPAGLRPSLRYKFSNIDYDGDSDGNLKRINDQQQHTVMAGVRGSVGEFFKWGVEVGAAEVYLLKRSPLLEPLTGHKKSAHFVARATGTWNLIPERTKLRANVNKDVVPSITGDYMDTLQIDVALTHRWTQRLSTHIGGGYGFYNRSKGEDFKTHDILGGVNYRITRWASVFSRYKFSQREAIGDKFGDSDNYENLINLGFSFAF